MSEEVEDDRPACAKERCKTKHGLGDHRDAWERPKDDSDEGISSPVMPSSEEAEAEEEEEGVLFSTNTQSAHTSGVRHIIVSGGDGGDEFFF